MEETRQPQPYPQPVPASPVSQRAQWLQQPLLPTPHPNNEPPSAEQPSLICGFTLTELANVAIQVAGVTIAAVFGAWAVKAYDSANVANQLSEDSLSQSNTANWLAQNALEQSLYANKLAIINLCLSDQYRNSADCPSILQDSLFASIVRGVIPTLSHISTTTRIPTASPVISRPSPPPVSASTTTTTTTSLPDSAATRSTPVPTATTLSGPIKNDVNRGSGHKPLAFGAIVGIIIGVVVALAFFCLLLIRYQRARRSRLRGPTGL